MNKEYDFSKITDDRLEYAVKEGKGSGYPCSKIKCDNCPFKDTPIWDNDYDGYAEMKRLFREELERRQGKAMKKGTLIKTQPELKAGMIVDAVLHGSRTERYMYINDGLMLNKDGEGWQNLTPSVEIVTVYNLVRGTGFMYIEEERLEKVWEKEVKSEKDIKIEEIQSKMDALKEELEELKGDK